MLECKTKAHKKVISKYGLLKEFHVGNTVMFYYLRGYNKLINYSQLEADLKKSSLRLVLKTTLLKIQDQSINQLILCQVFGKY